MIVLVGVCIGLAITVVACLALFAVDRFNQRFHREEPELRIQDPREPWYPPGEDLGGNDQRPPDVPIDRKNAGCSPPARTSVPEPLPRPEQLDRERGEHLLHHANIRVREIAADRLAEVGTSESTPALLEALTASIRAGENEAEHDVRIKIVKALGDVGDERCLSPLFECIPLYSRLIDVVAFEHAGAALLRVLRRSPGAGRRWLAQTQKEHCPAAVRTLAIAAASFGAPDAVDRLARALETQVNDWERVSLVASAAKLDDPRAVSVILKQLRSTVDRGGRELGKSLGEIVARLRTAIPSELLREVAQLLPIESSYLAGGPPIRVTVFLDGVRRTALDELERRGEGPVGQADAEESGAEELATYEVLASRLAVVSKQQMKSRMEDVRSLGEPQVETLEAEMLSLLENRGRAIPARALVGILRLPVDRKLILRVRELIWG